MFTEMQNALLSSENSKKSSEVFSSILKSIAESSQEQSSKTMILFLGGMLVFALFLLLHFSTFISDNSALFLLFISSNLLAFCTLPMKKSTRNHCLSGNGTSSIPPPKPSFAKEKKLLLLFLVVPIPFFGDLLSTEIQHGTLLRCI